MNAGIDKGAPLSLFWASLPYGATVLGLWILDIPLVAVGLYHAGILCLLVCHPCFPMTLPRGIRLDWLAGMSLLCLSVWPVLVLLWPFMHLPGVELGSSLSAWGLEGPWGFGFIVYSLTVHPVLEETFWRGLLPDRLLSDILFAGFHVLVMVLFLSWIWVLTGFLILCAAAFLWRMSKKKTGGLLVPILSHAVADFAIVLGVLHIVNT